MQNFFPPHRVLILHDYSLENIPLDVAHIYIYILSAMTNLTTYFEFTFVRMSELRVVWQHMYISILTRFSRSQDMKTIGNQQDWCTVAADGCMEAKQNMWHYYATEITGNPVGLPRDLSTTHCNHAHTMINVIAAIWNNHAQFVPAWHNLCWPVLGEFVPDSESANQIVYGVRCTPGSTFVDMPCSFAVN